MIGYSEKRWGALERRARSGEARPQPEVRSAPQRNARRERWLELLFY